MWSAHRYLTHEYDILCAYVYRLTLRRELDKKSTICRRNAIITDVSLQHRYILNYNCSVVLLIQICI